MLPLYDDNPHRRFPAVVVLLILACAGVMVYEVTLPSERALAGFVGEWGLVPARLWRDPQPEVWLRPLTSMFLHGGWLHLVGNCWFLWLFGNNIEDRLGHVAFAVFYGVCGLAAAAFQVAADPFSAVPMIGASGAIAGVLGAYLRLYPKAPVYTLVPLWFAPIVPIPAFVFIAIWFVFQFWQGVGSVFAGASAGGGVAWWAHVGGFIAGAALGPLLVRRRQR